MTLGHRPATLPLRLVLGATALLALAACGNETSATAADAPTSPAPTSASPTQQEEAPRLISYAGGESPGVEVKQRSDAAHLTGAPADFKQFIGDLAQQNADASSCADGYVGVTVQTLRTDGFAIGGVNDCGGYLALWAVVDGHWKEVAGTQELWDCKILARYQAPSDVVGDACYDYDAQHERAYQQA
ncbi:hypothetical protein FB382_002692 [Nocardioides ginsengisegetis]|uniref:Lipoprotein n=1 Tax=Nocardioides ginsengisegetis TaxID=661491 RepID=A0A7W3PAE5_9ACTN|nr:hypothetical protein [Nocardioides ginsengisegetis]MBA8804401.1 hypothetical protein [Nocardioides ginsengisegetis]